MKVLLARDVPGVGKEGTVKEVSAGYARNYLLPRRLAVVATPENERRLGAEHRRRTAEAEARARSVREMAEGLDGRAVNVRARVNEQGVLFGSVGPAQIAAALNEEHGLQIQESQVEIAEPFKQPDTYPATVHFPGGLKSKVKVWVLEE